MRTKWRAERKAGTYLLTGVDYGFGPFWEKKGWAMEQQEIEKDFLRFQNSKRKQKLTWEKGLGGGGGSGKRDGVGFPLKVSY